MINHLLVEEIVKEVLRNIECLERNGMPALIVIHRGTDKDRESMKELQRHWHVIEVLDANDQIPPAIQRAVFLEVSQDLFVKAALGITDTRESLLFSKMMMDGMQIDFILSESLSWVLQQEQINKRYVQMLLHYQNQLSNFGVRFFPSCHYLLPVKKMDGPHSDKVDFDGKLLTKAMIDGWAKDSIMVHPSTIITPLARDAAKEKKISILKGGEDHDESIRYARNDWGGNLD